MSFYMFEGNLNVCAKEGEEEKEERLEVVDKSFCGSKWVVM